MRVLIAMACCCALSGCGEDLTRVKVTAAEYGERWPLSVSEAVIGCYPSRIRYLDIDGTWFALNGSALRAGLPRANAVAKDSSHAGLADFSARAGTLCEG